MDALTDPETLRDRDDVEYVEKSPEVHQHHYDLFESAAGTTIAGLTDDAGRVCLLEHEAVDLPALCYTVVDPGDDYVAGARDIVETSTGVEATIDDVRRVRRCTYRSEDGEETTSHDVVFAASPVDSTDLDPEAGHDWTAAWRDPATLDLPDEEDNDVLDDIRLFL
ncbi:hypothetical protein ACFPYI_11295 [Halomarina salina]|uniref:Nudix hydrolase domain-containing protein n=1 Tax=Halomarina salina TaxID=1872699 RepID=A0ABD5RMP5_9EURY|nr:hypothetical protein [Halomarina salina]